MLKIRLTKTGKRHEPHFRVIVDEARSKRDGRFIIQIGHWHPKDGELVLDKKLYQEWVGKGAIPTQTVRELFEKGKVTRKKKKKAQVGQVEQVESADAKAVVGKEKEVEEAKTE